jgi:WD40 repeat protein
MMRGRQIGNWISQRQAIDPAQEREWSTEQLPRRSKFWRITRLSLLLALILAVAWWVHREGGYRRFIASLREGKVQYVEFQPFPNSAFVRVSDEKGIAGVADWLRDARPVDRRYGPLPSADCQMRIVMADGSVKQLWTGATGPTRSGGVLLPNGGYVLLKGDGWQRVGFSGALGGVYMRLPASAQLPFNAIPVAPTPTMVGGIATTAPTTVLGEVDASEALALLDRGQLGAARRVLARALAANPNNGSAQQFMLDTQARIRIRLPLALKELEKELPENPPKLDREKYLQIREKVMEAALMADVGDERIAEFRRFRRRLAAARPEARVKEFKELVRLGGGQYSISDFAWSPDCATIATCGELGRIGIWDAINGDLLTSFPAVRGSKIHFSDDGQKVGVWTEQGLSWWDVTTGKAAAEGKVADEPTFEFRPHVNGLDTVGVKSNKDDQLLAKLVGHAGTVRLAKISPDGDSIASFGDDKVLAIWGDGVTRLNELSPMERLVQLGELDGPNVFLKDGSIFMFKGGQVSLGPHQPGKELKVWRADVPGMVRRVEFSATCERALADGGDGKVLVLEVEKKTVRPIPSIEGSCGQAALSPNGKAIAIGNIDGSVRLIDADTGVAWASLACTPSRNRKWAAVQFSADGGWIMACGEGFVSVWNTQTREQVFYSEKAAVEGIAATFTTDGKGLAIIYRDGGLRMIRGALKESNAVGWDQLAMRDPTFSRDGKWLAAVSKTGEVAIFDSSANLICHFAAKVSVASPEPLKFNEDGSVLLIKAEDNSVRLVEVLSGRELRRLTIKGEPNWLDMPCSLSADGKYVITGRMVWGVN